MSSKNIYQKLANVMKRVKYVQKTGYNTFHKYKYAKEADYIESIRPALLEEDLIVTSSTESVTVTGELTSVLVRFTIVNVSNPAESISVVCPGQGADKGDKGVYKALTGAKKYFIGMTFLIETGDDAEADESTDARASKSAAPKAEDKSASVAAADLTKTVTAAPAAAAAEAKPALKPKGGSFRKVGAPAKAAAPAAAEASGDLDL